MAGACVRCGVPLQGRHCAEHGTVPALHVLTPDAPLAAAAAVLDVPLWLLAPPPVGWSLGGTAYAGDGRTTCASATAWSGPAPLGGEADLVVVAEEPGVGLGARYAGLDGLDAGACVVGPPADHVEVDGHPVALWACAEAPPDRCVLVGEADGGWLWLVLWPASADPVYAESLALADARAGGHPPPRGRAVGRLGP